MKNLKFYIYYCKVLLKVTFAYIMLSSIYNDFESIKFFCVLFLTITVYYVYYVFVKQSILKRYYALRILVPLFFYKSFKIVKLFVLYIIRGLFFYLKKPVKTFGNIFMDTKKMDVFLRKYHLRFMMRVVWFYVGFINYTLLSYYNNYFKYYIDKIVNFCEKKIFLLDVKKYKFIYFIIFLAFSVLFLIKLKDTVYSNFFKLYLFYFEDSVSSDLLIKHFPDENTVRFDCLKKRYFNYKDYRFLKFIDYSFLMRLIEVDICSFLGSDIDINADRTILKNLKIDNKNKYTVIEEEIAFYKGFFKIKYFFNKCFDVYLLKVSKPSFISTLLSNDWSRFKIANYFKDVVLPFKHKFFYSSGFFPSLNKELHENLIDFFISKKRRSSSKFKDNIAYYRIIKDSLLSKSNFSIFSSEKELKNVSFSLEKKLNSINRDSLNKFFCYEGPRRTRKIKRIFSRRSNGVIRRFSIPAFAVSSKRRFVAKDWNLLSMNRRFVFYKAEPFLFKKEKDFISKYTNRKKYLDLVLYRNFNSYKANNSRYILNNLSFKFKYKTFFSIKNYGDAVFQKEDNFYAQFNHFITLKKIEQSRKLLSFFYTFKNHKIDAKYRCLLYFYWNKDEKSELSFFDKILYEKLLDCEQDKSLLNIFEKKKGVDHFLKKKKVNYIDYDETSPVIKFLSELVFILGKMLKVVFMWLYTHILSKITFWNIWWLIKGILNFSHFDNFVYGVKKKAPVKDYHYWAENLYRRKNTFNRVDTQKDSKGSSIIKYRPERLKLRSFKHIEHYFTRKKSEKLLSKKYKYLTFLKQGEISTYADEYKFSKYYKKLKKTRRWMFKLGISKNKSNNNNSIIGGFWDWGKKKNLKFVKRYKFYTDSNWPLRRSKRRFNKLANKNINYLTTGPYSKIKNKLKKKS